jgi:hypothetical protein
MNHLHALAECAHVMRELHEVREAGFTEEALKFPRPPHALRLLCAFNGAPPGWEAPHGWHYFPNLASLRAWTRVMEAADTGGSALDLARAYAPSIVGFANEPMRKAWERVRAADWEWREAA